MEKKALHINASKEQIAKTVIMPGDPLRAKYIIEKYFDDYELVSTIRNIYCYTGHYQGKLLTVMASGMGISSMAIYAYELFKYYDVENIIRIGTCGSFIKRLNVGELVLVNSSYTNSNFAYNFDNQYENIVDSSKTINKKILREAELENLSITSRNIFCSEVFYSNDLNYATKAKGLECIGVEMESFPLFYLAKKFECEASCILTVSDSFITDEVMSAEERERSLDKMITLALNSCL